jgi:hypothetical protein
VKEDAPVQAQDGSEAVRQATSRLNELASGFRASQALYVAAEFGIADHLADRSLTSAELAKLCGTNCNALNRADARAVCVRSVFGVAIGRVLADQRRTVVEKRHSGIVSSGCAVHVRAGTMALLVEAGRYHKNRRESERSSVGDAAVRFLCFESRRIKNP